MTWHISGALRAANAKRAAATRKAKGEKPFGGKHAHHHAATHHTTPHTRVHAAKKAAISRHTHKVAKI